MKTTRTTDRASQDRATRERPRALYADERGAVMVLGIFMCTCLVGVLWYIAGIGDAIIYRERLQEAADATAFSGAVMHARAMNLIVLINLVMACVLAIRVALKVIQIALIVAAIVFAIIGIFVPIFETAAIACEKAVEGVEQLIKITRPIINNTLKALSKVEVAIAKAGPFAAIAASYQVADKYKPVVSTGFSGTSADRYAKGLPVEEGTTDRLCGEAGRALSVVLLWAIPVPMLRDGKVGKKFGDMMSSITKGGSGYFCELGGAGGAPDLSDIVNSGAKETCEEEKKKLDKEFSEANSPWHRECDRLQVECLDEDPYHPFEPRPDSHMGTMDNLKPAQQAELRRLKEDRDAKSDAVRNFNDERCQAQKRDQMKKEINKKMPAGTTGNGQGMTPKKVEAKWMNGRNDTQMIAWINGSERLRQMSTGGVKIAAMNNPKAGNIDTPMGAGFSFAQAEFFYDCAGAWGGQDCNGKGGDQEEAMWHFRWRARLRRYNRPYDNLIAVLEGPFLVPAQVELVKRAVAAGRKANSLDPGNIGLKGELAGAMGQSAKAYTVH